MCSVQELMRNLEVIESIFWDYAHVALHPGRTPPFL